ncbi:dTMP kinase [Pasteuria penetrans]|uniref:dTMP kinase n=1 Tax=Pasteuria penetrans TaxID=86005 RepID=UPI000F9390EF|nr:dTMP kinase [Pasteuria penetrans]
MGTRRGDRPIGFFITLEGLEGAGKTTQACHLKNWLSQQGCAYTITKDPGGTLVGDQVRNLLMKEGEGDLSWKTQVLLYASARAQLVDKVIVPNLLAGHVVVSDRYLDSNIAYQFYGEGKDPALGMKWLTWASDGWVPHRTYLLDLTVEESRHRLQQRGQQLDPMECREDAFYHRVRRGYHELAEQSADRFCVIDATLPEKTISEMICGDCRRLLSWRGALGGSDGTMFEIG